MSIRAILVEPLVVFVEVVNFLDCFELLLQLVLNFEREAAPVIVKNFAKILVIEIFIEGFAQGMEDHSHVESCQPSFEANLVSCFFEDNLFTFKLLVGVIELWNLKQNPESLAIKLFAEVGIKKLRHLVVLSDCQKG